MFRSLVALSNLVVIATASACVVSTPPPEPAAEPVAAVITRSDRDGDGIVDDDDACPDEPGLADQRGCPPPRDADGDGLVDASDACAREPEDKDGYQDDDGCPDPDNDADGITDAMDRCPGQPETVNGVDDGDGCPDRGTMVAGATTRTEPTRTEPTRTEPTRTEPAKRPSEPSAARSLDPSSAPVARTLASGAQIAWVLAVMEVDTNDVALKAPVRRGLTDQLRVYLGERRLRAIDRSSQETALKQLVDEEKKKSYAACVDASCQIPLGKALAATHLLRTSITRFDTVCALSAELIDLKAEVQIAAASTRAACAADKLLDGIERVADDLVRQSAH
ncbi:hypothetical protein L6R52_15695 [Myxococcota bacterium]|nr:hypothetical protein [Myxococcota bacterium]